MMSLKNYWAYFAFLSFAFVLLSCSDSSGPKDKKEAEFFPLSLNTVWNYEHPTNNSKMVLKIVEISEQTWASAFWDTDDQYLETTYVLRQTFQGGDLQTTRYFALSKYTYIDEEDNNKETLYLRFGSSFHPLVSKTKTMDYYVRIFDIPIILGEYDIFTSLVSGTHTYSDLFKTKYAQFDFNSKVYSGMDIEHYASSTEQNGAVDTYGLDVIFMKEIGFVKFGDYKLVSFVLE